LSTFHHILPSTIQSTLFPYTTLFRSKWNWVAQSADKIPEVTRRAFKFASTMPSGPVFLAYPEDILDEEAQASVIDQAKFEVSMKIGRHTSELQSPDHLVCRLLLEKKK